MLTYCQMISSSFAIWCNSLSHHILRSRPLSKKPSLNSHTFPRLTFPVCHQVEWVNHSAALLLVHLGKVHVKLELHTNLFTKNNNMIVNANEVANRNFIQTQKFVKSCAVTPTYSGNSLHIVISHRIKCCIRPWPCQLHVLATVIHCVIQPPWLIPCHV